jgi:hypothetical protein
MRRLLLLLLLLAAALPAGGQRDPVIRSTRTGSRSAVSRSSVSRTSRLIRDGDHSVVLETPTVIGSGGNVNISAGDFGQGVDGNGLGAALADVDASSSSEVGSSSGNQAISDSETAQGTDSGGASTGVVAPPVAFDGFESGYLTASINNGPSTSQPNSGSPTTSLGTASLVTSPVHSGSYAVRCNPGVGVKGYFGAKAFNSAGEAVTYSISIPTSYTTFWWQWTVAPTTGDEPICQINSTLSGTAAKIEVRLNSAHQLAAYDNTFALMATGTTTIPSSTWERIDVECGTGSNAPWEVRINGVSEMSGTSSNLGVGGAPGTAAATGMAKIGRVIDRHSNAVTFYYDDWCIRSDQYADPTQRSGILRVASDSSPQTWSVGAGSGAHWQLVSELPPNGNTSYLLSTLTPGNAELFGVQSAAAAGITGTPLAVSACAFFTTAGANLTGNIIMRMISGGTTVSTTGLPAIANTSFDPVGLFRQTDPNGGIPWTLTSIGNLQIGVVENSSTVRVEVTNAFVLVNYVP